MADSLLISYILSFLHYNLSFLCASHSWHTDHFSVPQTHSSFPELKALNPMFLMKYSARSAPPSLFTGKLPILWGLVSSEVSFPQLSFLLISLSHTHMTLLLQHLMLNCGQSLLNSRDTKGPQYLHSLLECWTVKSTNILNIYESLGQHSDNFKSWMILKLNVMSYIFTETMLYFII